MAVQFSKSHDGGAEERDREGEGIMKVRVRERGNEEETHRGRE